MTPATLYRGTVVDAVGEFPGAGLRVEQDGGLLVRDGVITARGSFAQLRRDHNGPVTDLAGGLLLPGFVDTHVHFPQLRVIGALGLPLLDWLDSVALPAEARLADRGHAVSIADEFVAALIRSGTTSALVFGSHFAAAQDALFASASAAGLRVTSGLVVSDRALPRPLLTDVDRAVDQSTLLAERWHGTGRLRYAVTPRFSLSCSESLLKACGELAAGSGLFATSHVNENGAEIAAVARDFPASSDYVDTYGRAGLLGERTVLAHNVHPTDAELSALAASGTVVAHCPTSNAALGSGLFPMRRHLQAGVRIALGSDVGGGTGLSMLKEALQAAFTQRLLAQDGFPLTVADLLHLATRSGAAALDRAEVGGFDVGQQFDAVWLRPHAGTLATVLANADSPDAALGAVFALGGDADIAGVWVAGQQLSARPPAAGPAPDHQAEPLLPSPD